MYSLTRKEKHGEKKHPDQSDRVDAGTRRPGAYACRGQASQRRDATDGLTHRLASNSDTSRPDDDEPSPHPPELVVCASLVPTVVSAVPVPVSPTPPQLTNRNMGQPSRRDSPQVCDESRRRHTNWWRAAFCLLAAIVIGAVVYIAITRPWEAQEDAASPSSWVIHSWSQLGSDIDGERTGDFFGRSVDMSSDGFILAGGGPTRQNTIPGRAQVFRYSERNSQWNPKGQTLYGSENGDRFGWVVRLSADGNILAVGAIGKTQSGGQVRLFKYDERDDEWIPLGQSLDGLAPRDNFGTNAALSTDGSIVVASGIAHNNITGYVSAHGYDEGTRRWLPMGQVLHGVMTGERFGWSVSLSSDGRILAISARDNSDDTGRVIVFRYNPATKEWVQRGPQLTGDAAGDRFGYAVSLSGDGSLLAVGAPRHDNTFENSGVAKVFQYFGKDNTWKQIGQNLYGDQQGDAFGEAVDLSEDGSVLAVGSVFAKGSGTVKIFGFVRTTRGWSQIGSDVDGERMGDWFGRVVSLSSDGSRFVSSGPYNGDGGEETGHIRVFRVVGVEI